jgi:hypothetical protein
MLAADIASASEAEKARSSAFLLVIFFSPPIFHGVPVIGAPGMLGQPRTRIPIAIL